MAIIEIHIEEKYMANLARIGLNHVEFMMSRGNDNIPSFEESVENLKEYILNLDCDKDHKMELLFFLSRLGLELFNDMIKQQMSGLIKKFKEDFLNEFTS